MFEWEEADRFSFEDSDRFEEDSICSWISEPESVVNNWRGWRKPNANTSYADRNRNTDKDGNVLSLVELAAREVASSIPFELVEHYSDAKEPVPEDLQLRIAFWSFPEQEEDIRLYSCLANGAAEEFVKGEHLFKNKAVKEPLQIGFHLSALIEPGVGKQSQTTSVKFDRRKINSCQCSCNSQAEWCSHVVALCLHRIHMGNTVTLRAPVYETLTRLKIDQLMKFALYFIHHLPFKFLPTAQKILDDLLSKTPTELNTTIGGPDPTSGGTIDEQTAWYLDGKNLKDNIRKILVKFCVPAPIVFSDVNYLSTSAPPSASEWCSFLRPLRGREPGGMWNLLSIVREMFKRNDRNSIPLLEIVTLQCLETNQIMVWWFNTKVALHQKNQGKHNVNSNSQASQNACASLCDEIVTLWKLAALNPCISPQERHTLRQRLIAYHLTVIEKVQAHQQGNNTSKTPSSVGTCRKLTDLELFSGFKPAIEASRLGWEDYPIPGVTYGHNSHYLSPFAVFKADESDPTLHNSQVNSSQAVLRCEYPAAARPEKRIPENPPAEEAEAKAEMKAVGQSGGESGNESSPDRDIDSDWSSGAFGEDNKPAGAPNGAAVAPEEDMQYRVYFYDPKIPLARSKEEAESPKEEMDVFRNLRKIEDPWEVLFMRAEGIHAHGYHAEACKMAIHLAQELLRNPPDLMADAPPLVSKGKKKRVSAASHQITHTASTTLAHCAFLCTVLSENQQYYNLAFQVGMFGLEMARPPASTKPMEVKLAHQESELVNLLKRIPLGPNELDIIRSRAMQLKEGTLRSRGEALLPLMLSSYIFESLVIGLSTGVRFPFRPSDELLGFDAAVAAIGLKANVSEADHPLLCEGTRRQRGDLALLLLVNYKDDPERLARIMDKLLDKDIHQLFKSPPLPSYYASANMRGGEPHMRPPTHAQEIGMEFAAMNLGGARPRRGRGAAAAAAVLTPPPPPQPPAEWETYSSWENNLRRGGKGQASGAQALRTGGASGGASALADLSAPGSSEGSPTLGRRRAPPPAPGSDSGSSGNSSADSIESSSSSSRHQNLLAGHRNYPFEASPEVANNAIHGVHRQPPNMEMSHLTRTTLPNIKVTRFKGKRMYPSIPNQPSEACAHFMFELAKTVLTKAGGNSSTSLFTQSSANQHPRGHRALQVCAFQIGLYALGLHNRVSPNWLSRTYSSHVSWITGQASEIGSTAISFLVATWEGHLTPPEAASIADRASRGPRDPSMIRAAADLSLSVLPHAAALNPNEIQRAIQQCKEQSDAMLEKACLAVEKAAAGGGVYPEVMFEVARYWFAIYQKHVGINSSAMPPQPRQEQPIHLDPSVTLPQPVVTTAHMHPPLPLAPPPLQLPFPVYGLIPNFPTQGQAAAAAAAQIHMLIPPQQALQLQHAVQQGNAAAFNQGAQPNPAAAVQVIPPTTTARYNLAAAAGGPLYQFSLPPTLLATAPMPQSNLQAFQAAAVVSQHQALMSQPPPQQSPAVNHPQPPSAVPHPAGPAPQQQHPAAASQRFLLAAYRVGMVALDNLGRKVNEDRPQVKFARNPSYGEDVKWLMNVAQQLGPQYLQRFLMTVVATVVSPFLLQDLAWECATALCLTGFQVQGQVQINQILHQLRSQPFLTQLLHKCFQAYSYCIHQKLYHLLPSDYEDFVTLLVHARKAFNWIPEGEGSFQQLLQSIRRNKSCKKDLWQKILTAVQHTSQDHQ